MDVLPTLMAAAGIEATTHYPLDGNNMLAAITGQAYIPRGQAPLLYFGNALQKPYKRNSV